jgi:hypothetical protein
VDRRPWCDCSSAAPSRRRSTARSPDPVAEGLPEGKLRIEGRGRFAGAAGGRRRAGSRVRYSSLKPRSSPLSCRIESSQGGHGMAARPIVTKLLCVALVASIMLPLGRMVFPLVETFVSGMEFDTLQAVLSATIGFGLYAAIFG